MQLFAHLLSSYLQGMEDFFSALQREGVQTGAPPQPSPKGGSTTKPPKTQQEWAPAPWGGPGRGFRRAGEGLSELGRASLPLPRLPYFFAKNFWKKRS